MKNSERNEKKTIDPEMKKIGERIKKLLKAKNITQEKVALKIGYTASTLSEKLAGKTKFVTADDQLVKTARDIGISFGD